MAIDTANMEATEWASLNARQQSQAEALTELATQYGMFNQTSGADGAHYAPGAKNPFRAEGLKCGNCIFFNEAGQCQIVAGVIEAEAVCKLWIIPENALAPQPITSRADLKNMSSTEIMNAKAQGRLDGMLGKSTNQR